MATLVTARSASEERRVGEASVGALSLAEIAGNNATMVAQPDVGWTVRNAPALQLPSPIRGTAQWLELGGGPTHGFALSAPAVGVSREGKAICEDPDCTVHNMPDAAEQISVEKGEIDGLVRADSEVTAADLAPHAFDAILSMATVNRREVPEIMAADRLDDEGNHSMQHAIHRDELLALLDQGALSSIDDEREVTSIVSRTLLNTMMRIAWVHSQDSSEDLELLTILFANVNERVIREAFQADLCRKQVGSGNHKGFLLGSAPGCYFGSFFLTWYLKNCFGLDIYPSGVRIPDSEVQWYFRKLQHVHSLLKRHRCLPKLDAIGPLPAPRRSVNDANRPPSPTGRIPFPRHLEFSPHLEVLPLSHLCRFLIRECLPANVRFATTLLPLPAEIRRFLLHGSLDQPAPMSPL